MQNVEPHWGSTLGAYHGRVEGGMSTLLLKLKLVWPHPPSHLQNPVHASGLILFIRYLMPSLYYSETERELPKNL